MLHQIIPNESERDESLVNPASIDIRLGKPIITEGHTSGLSRETDIHEAGYRLDPGEFILARTYERISVPNGYAISLYLKSSTARKGLNHMLAFWVDPGWDGYLTMELKNELRHTPIILKPGMKIAQIVVDRLDGLSAKPYNGKYQGATSVEGIKQDVADNKQIQLALS